MNHKTFKSYFGFTCEPFCKSIKANSLFLSNALNSLKNQLMHHLERPGIALITGDVGCGKTTAIRLFVQLLDKNHYDVVYIDDPTLGLRGIWHLIASQLKLDSRYFKWQLMPILKTAIDKNYNDYKKQTIVIIDDAQLLKIQALEELRLFTNFKLDSQSPLKLILLAQPEFKKMIQLKSLEAFNQRITFRVHLTGLEQDEVKDFIKHQLETAGRTDELFSDDAIAEIFQQARGLPRIINNLCYQALFDIYTLQKNIVDMPTIEKIMSEFQTGL
jgi:type II secretory pathway predicted ATPase ExeA